MAKEKIYLSAPISAYVTTADGEQERREYFKGYADKLEAVGYKVFNPMENGLPFNAEHEEHMKKDIRELLKCDAIVMLSGWQLSKGCKTEWEVAKAVGLRVLYESDLAAVLEYGEGGAL